MPLSMADKNKRWEIVDIAGGRNIKQRLSALGLYPGSIIKMVTNDFGGPLIIEVSNSKIAIGRGMAQKIIVNETQ